MQNSNGIDHGVKTGLRMNSQTFRDRMFSLLVKYWTKLRRGVNGQRRPIQLWKNAMFPVLPAEVPGAQTINYSGENFPDRGQLPIA